jgi:large subunit ribosomal protein L30
MAAPNSSPVKVLRITYSKSAIGYKKDQKATIAALGFRKLGQTRELKDTPSIRGMVRKVAHLVTVEEL